jgi:tetratricopeptide (TPR) repeat protein
MLRFALFVLAALVAGCTSSSGGAEASPEAVQLALNDCTSGDPTRGIAALDSLLAGDPDAADALASRGICYWTRFSADSARADIRAAHADLSKAIDLAESSGGTAGTMSLDRLYSHRAFVAVARDPDSWSETIADLDKAAALNPAFPTHVLDRGMARLMSGDTTAARVDFEAFLTVAATDTARADRVRAMLGQLDGSALPTE